MPLQVLTKVISTLGGSLIDCRWKCEFLFGWWAGFPPLTIRRLTRAATVIAADKLSLRVTWEPARRRIRSILIPAARNPKICLIRALQDWFGRSNIPDDPTVLLFPRLSARGRRVKEWLVPPDAILSTRLNAAMRNLGIEKHPYDFTSIRRAHALACVGRMGEAATVYRCGFASSKTLHYFLRGEPRWDLVPPNPLEPAG